MILRQRTWVALRLFTALGAIGMVASVAFAPPVAAEEDFSTFQGVWERRDAALVVDADGLTLFRWKTGACQGDSDPNPCDDVIGGRQVYGGLLEIVLTDIAATDPNVALGKVAITNSPDMAQRGASISIGRLADDLLYVDTGVGQRILLCKPPRDANSCDAP